MTITDPRELLDRFDLTPATVGDLLEHIRGRMTLEVAAVRDEHGDGTAFPVVEFADVVADRVPPASIDRIRRRGCVVLRGTFERSQAEAWDEQIAGYLAANSFDAVFADRYPEAAATGSRIWGVYWSVAAGRGAVSTRTWRPPRALPELDLAPRR